MVTDLSDHRTTKFLAEQRSLRSADHQIKQLLQQLQQNQTAAAVQPRLLAAVQAVVGMPERRIEVIRTATPPPRQDFNNALLDENRRLQQLLFMQQLYNNQDSNNNREIPKEIPRNNSKEILKEITRDVPRDRQRETPQRNDNHNYGYLWDRNNQTYQPYQLQPIYIERYTSIMPLNYNLYYMIKPDLTMVIMVI